MSASTAIRGAIPSCSTVHNHQQGARTNNAPLARGYGRDWSASCRAGFVGFDAPTNGRGLRASGYRISHRPGFSSLTGRLATECAFAGAPVITNSLDHCGSRRQVVHSIAHQHFNKHFADALHVQNRLSSSLVLVGIDPNENGLTHGKQEFAPGAKAND